MNHGRPQSVRNACDRPLPLEGEQPANLTCGGVEGHARHARTTWADNRMAASSGATIRPGTGAGVESGPREAFVEFVMRVWGRASCGTLLNCFTPRQIRQRSLRQRLVVRFGMSNFTCPAGKNGRATPSLSSSLRSCADITCGISGSTLGNENCPAAIFVLKPTSTYQWHGTSPDSPARCLTEEGHEAGGLRPQDGTPICRRHLAHRFSSTEKVAAPINSARE